MNRSSWLSTAETSVLWQESATPSAASENGWTTVATVAVVLALVALGVSVRRWRRKGGTPSPVPLPDWLAQEALKAVLVTPVGPKTPDETKAYRLARLLIGEMNEFCETQIELGLRHKDLYARLKQDLDRSRETYLEMAPGVEKDFLQQEVLHCVAKGDPTALG